MSLYKGPVIIVALCVLVVSSLLLKLLALCFGDSADFPFEVSAFLKKLNHISVAILAAAICLMLLEGV